MCVTWFEFGFQFNFTGQKHKKEEKKWINNEKQMNERNEKVTHKTPKVKNKCNVLRAVERVKWLKIAIIRVVWGFKTRNNKCTYFSTNTQDHLISKMLHFVYIKAIDGQQQQKQRKKRYKIQIKKRDTYIQYKNTKKGYDSLYFFFCILLHWCMV